jgi:hypothetical protein
MSWEGKITPHQHGASEKNTFPKKNSFLTHANQICESPGSMPTFEFRKNKKRNSHILKNEKPFTDSARVAAVFL